jgi:hypothetical protein
MQRLPCCSLQSAGYSQSDAIYVQSHRVGRPTISLLLRRIMPDAVRVASDAMASRRNDALRACSI